MYINRRKASKKSWNCVGGSIITGSGRGACIYKYVEGQQEKLESRRRERAGAKPPPERKGSYY